MPYKTTADLPSALQSRLPQHAQEIYKEAFNSAWETYGDSKKREEGSREEISHKVAWGAVKRTYARHNGNWRRKE